MTLDLHPFVDLDYCYLTTTGRVTGRPHMIEISFALNDHTLYLLSGNKEKADWVKNLTRSPEVRVRLDRSHLPARRALSRIRKKPPWRVSWFFLNTNRVTRVS